MSATPTMLELTRCPDCRLAYLPTDGPCPKCGSLRGAPFPVPDAGRVAAATEITAPAPGWPVPHRIALVEVAEGVRVLAVVAGPLPRIDDPVHVRLEGDTYRAHPGNGPKAERGEGESPRARRRGSSFEPPR